MKTRLHKHLIVLFALAISIFSGANVFAAENPFELINLSVSDKSADVEGDASLNAAGEIENNIVFHHVGSWVEYLLELKNIGTKAATITSISDNNTNPYISYSYDDHAGEEVAAGASLMLKVKATYENEVTALSDRSQNTAMKISINYITEEWVSGTADFVMTVPDTGANILTNIFNGSSNPIAIIITAGLGVVVLIVCVVKRKSKVAAVVFALAFAITFASVSNSTAETAKVNEVLADFAFDFGGSFELDDKLAVNYTIDGVDGVQAIGWGMTVGDLQKPTREGYNFTRWYDVNGRYVDGSTLITGDLNLVPDWNPKLARFSAGCTYCGADYNQYGYNSIQNNLKNAKFSYDSVKTKTALGSSTTADVFMKSPTKPDETTIASALSVGASDAGFYPIYVWYNATDNAIYWWSEAAQVRLPATAKYMFYQFPAKKIDLTGLTATYTTNMEGFFEYSKAQQIVFGEDLDTSRVYNMGSMFYGASSLNSVDFANLDTSSNSDFSYMFNDTKTFTTLDISMLDMSSMYSMKSMFSYMTNLTDIKLPAIEITQDVDLSELFDQDSSLVTVDISPIIFDEYSCPNLENMFRSNKNLVTIYADPSVNYYGNNDCVWVESGYPGESDYVRDFTIFGGDTKLVGGNGSSYTTHRPKGNYPNAGSDYYDSAYYEPANEAPYFRIDGANNRRGFLTAKP